MGHWNATNKAEVNKGRIGIYARYSSHNQDDGTSIEVQLDVCRRAAGMPTVEYVDRAVSGTTMRREAFCRLLEDCQAGRISTVYVYKWDRFGRSARAHAVLADLEEWGVSVISATEGREPLSRGIQLVVAEDFSRKLAERVRAAKQLRFQQGGFPGGTPPFGYRVVTDGHLRRLVPDSGGEAEVVSWLFRTYAHDSVGTKQMARMLNQKGIRARRAEYWGASAVRMLLTNTIYVGRPVRIGKATARQRHQCLLHHDNPKRVERVDESLRLIDDQTFQTVQHKQRQRKILRPLGHNRIRRFSKTLRCGCCGSIFVRTGHNSERHQYWTCGLRQRQDTGKCPNSVYLNENDLTQSVQRGIAEVFTQSDEIIADATARADEMLHHHQNRLTELNKSIAKVETELEKLATRLLDGDLNDPSVKRLLSSKVAETTAARDGLYEAREQLMNSAEGTEGGTTAVVRGVVEAMRHSLGSMTTDSEFNQFVHDFVGEMLVFPDGSLRQAEKSHITASAQSAQSNWPGFMAGAGR